jgi:hypothetical protein
MNTKQIQFSEIVESIYGLPLDVKRELMNLLENNIADERRIEIADNLKLSKKEERDGSLKFSSKMDELKKMI